MTSPQLQIRHLLGLQAYEPVWKAMQEYTEQRDANSADEIWLLQHQPVYTLGRNGKPEHILNHVEIPVVQIDRGGQVTYHAPEAGRARDGQCYGKCHYQCTGNLWR